MEMSFNHLALAGLCLFLCTFTVLSRYEDISRRTLQYVGQRVGGGGGGGDGQSVLWDGMTIGIVHRDFSNADVPSFVERMKLAVERSRRRLQSFGKAVKRAKDASADDYRAPVSAADGAYLTTLSIGTPPVKFTAIVDTGSDLVWCQCKPCDPCYKQTGHIFDPSKSSTYRKVSCRDSLCHALPQSQCSPTCQYSYEYGDQSSTSGDLSFDTLTLTDASSGRTHSIPHFGFGCGHDNGGNSFSQDEGGLLGLGQGPLSLLSQISAPKVSYCLVSITDSRSQTSPMIIGTTVTLSGSHVQSTPIITSPLIDTFYYITLKGISVGGTALDIPSGAFDLQSDGRGGTIIDSGTTLTFLIDDGYEPLLSAFKSAINLPLADGSSLGLDLCYQHTGNVPSLTFHFEGADFDLPTDNYFIDIDGLFCLAIAGSSDLSMDISVFGNIQQQNHHILFDRSAQKLFFTTTICDEL